MKKVVKFNKSKMKKEFEKLENLKESLEKRIMQLQTEEDVIFKDTIENSWYKKGEEHALIRTKTEVEKLLNTTNNTVKN